MADTNSSVLGVIGAPLAAASLHLRAMSHANPSLFDLVDASFEGADISVFFCCPGTMALANSIFNSSIGAPLTAAYSHICTMSNANPSIFDFMGASFEGADIFFSQSWRYCIQPHFPHLPLAR
jgi:hypothetical protein